MGKIVATIRRALPLLQRKKTGATPAGLESGAIKRGSSRTMSQLWGGILRSFSVALMIAVPALFLPDISPDIAQAVTLLAIVCGTVVLAEYSAAYPGLVEFRDAKPYNRIRFILLFGIVLLLTLLQRNITSTPDGLSFLATIAAGLHSMLDFSFSPVRMLILSLPAGLDSAHLHNVAISASLAYMLSLVGLIGFFAAILTGYWPARDASFNVWINLPNFDPTKGIDVVQRLERDAQINVLLGVLLPFSLPVLLHVSTMLVQPLTLETPLSLVWGLSIWAFLPVSLIMRGIAMYRVAQLIRLQRRRAAAEIDAIPVPAPSAYS